MSKYCFLALMLITVTISLRVEAIADGMDLQTVGAFPPCPCVHENWYNKSGSDSVPYVVVTSPELKPIFDDFARWKRLKGTKTQVVTTAMIAANYSGDSLQIKIREYLRDKFTNSHTQWVMIGGDLSHVPTMGVQWINTLLYTDQYYACLDFDWNEDGDARFGEASDQGDTTDSYTELYLGRVPCKDTVQARTFIDKLIAYESDTTKTTHQTRALFTSTDINYVGEDGFNQAMAAIFPENFTQTVFHSSDTAAVKAALKQGHGIIINTSHAQNYDQFLTYWAEGGPSYETRRGILWSFFEQNSTNGQYSLFINSTCHYNAILHDTSIARSFLFNPTGWGIGYLGSVLEDAPHMTGEFYQGILHNMFDSSYTQIGMAIAKARDRYQEPVWTWPFDHWIRYASLAIQYYGDPQTNVFTQTPEILHQSHPAWLPWGLGPQSFDVTVTSGGNPVESVLVCLSYEDSTIYELRYTDDNGVAHFDSVIVPDSISGDVSLVASKANYFTSTSTMELTHCGLPGDADDDCIVSIGDAVYLVNYIFGGGAAPVVPNRGDPDSTCFISITDANYIIAWIFSGGPDPRPGCVTLPAGGKVNAGALDPIDPEGVPDNLTITNHVSISVVRAPNGRRTLRLHSVQPVGGLSITLKTYRDAKIAVQTKMDEGTLDLYWSQRGSLVKIGLIDVYHGYQLPAGTYDLAEVVGDFEITCAQSVYTDEVGNTITSLPNFTNIGRVTDDYSFNPNYPNPFNPETTLEFAIPQTEHVVLAIYNVLGQKVRTVADDVFSAGHHSVQWDGTDELGRAVASGMYFAKFAAGEFRASRKMMIVK